MELRKLGMVGLGFVAGIAFVVACPASLELSPATTYAEPAGSTIRQPSGCRQWEIDTDHRFRKESHRDVAPGWEPFSGGDGLVRIRRCTLLEPGA